VTALDGLPAGSGREAPGRPAPIRVLVVDDSAVVRGLLSRLIDEEPDMEVAGTASNGELALRRLDEVDPDIVTLDVEMPVLDGLATVRQIRRLRPRLPVVMFSTLTSRGAATTLDALSAGASDYVTKPTSVTNVEAGIESLRAELVPRLRALTGRAAPAVVGGASRKGSYVGASAAGADPKGTRVGRARSTFVRVAAVDLVCVAVSTGGPKALEDLVPKLPVDLGAPVVIVQHMPPLFTGMLAARLDALSAVSVVEGSDGLQLRPGLVVIAPGGRHTVVRRRTTGGWIELRDDAPVNSCRPAADVLFASVAEGYRAGALGVVMTGMGHDGCDGAARLHEAGAEVLAQDEASSIVWGMPGSVVDAGLADDVLPLSELASAVSSRVWRRS
jgi:two-component system chemotaxis response regulator CheB